MIELGQDGTQEANDIVMQVDVDPSGVSPRTQPSHLHLFQHGLMDSTSKARHIEVEAVEAPDGQTADGVGQEASQGQLARTPQLPNGSTSKPVKLQHPFLTSGCACRRIRSARAAGSRRPQQSRQLSSGRLGSTWGRNRPSHADAAPIRQFAALLKKSGVKDILQPLSPTKQFAPKSCESLGSTPNKPFRPAPPRECRNEVQTPPALAVAREAVVK